MPWLLGKRDRFLEEPMAQQNKRECVYGGGAYEILYSAVLSAKQVSSACARRRSSDYSTRARSVVTRPMAQFALKAALPDAHEDGIWSVAWSSSGQIVTGACDEKVRTFTAYDGGKLERKHDFASHGIKLSGVELDLPAMMSNKAKAEKHKK